MSVSVYSIATALVITNRIKELKTCLEIDHILWAIHIIEENDNYCSHNLHTFAPIYTKNSITKYFANR